MRKYLSSRKFRLVTSAGGESDAFHALAPCLDLTEMSRMLAELEEPEGRFRMHPRCEGAIDRTEIAHGKIDRVKAHPFGDIQAGAQRYFRPGRSPELIAVLMDHPATGILRGHFLLSLQDGMPFKVRSRARGWEALELQAAA